MSLDLGDPHATGLFAVFDGHGGKVRVGRWYRWYRWCRWCRGMDRDVGMDLTADWASLAGMFMQLVASYASRHLPRALHGTSHFSEVDGDLGLAFAEAFYKIDEELDTEEGMRELRALAGVSGSSKNQKLFGDVEIEGVDLDGDGNNAGNGDLKPVCDVEGAVGTADDAGDMTESSGEVMKRSPSSKAFVESALTRDSVIGRAKASDDAETDDFAEHTACGMGCTAVAAMVRNGEVTIANTGDSRCVISRNGVAEPLTLDHKPVLLEEAERIMNAGGFVRDNRINGALNVSRTLGDLDFKRNANLPHTHQMVVATPDITTFKLQKGDEFVILACDGIWDVLSNQEAVDFVRKRVKAGQCLQSICEDMCDHCLAPDLQGLCRGADNMSVIILLFKGTSDLGKRSFFLRLASCFVK